MLNFIFKNYEFSEQSTMKNETHFDTKFRNSYYKNTTYKHSAFHSTSAEAE